MAEDERRPEIWRLRHYKWNVDRLIDRAKRELLPDHPAFQILDDLNDLDDGYLGPLPDRYFEEL